MEIAKGIAEETGKKLFDVRWIFLPVVILILSFLLLAIGFLIKTPTDVQLFSTAWYGDFAWALGKILLAAGIFSAFMRTFHSISFLESVLDKFIWSDSVLAKRNDIDELWIKLSIFKYGFFSNSAAVDDKMFLGKLSSAMKDIVAGEDEDHFIRVRNRTIDISWEDEEKSILKMNDSYEYDVIPKKQKYVKIKTRITTIGNTKISAYNISKDEIFLISEENKRLDIKREDFADHIETTYELNGASSYALKRERIVCWSLVDDPVLSITTRIVCDGYQLELNCNVPNIKTKFKEHGNRKCFVDGMTDEQKVMRPGDQRQKCKGILLPGNGFSVFFAKLP